MNSRILILHTGGTIGMEEAPGGLRPIPLFGNILKKWINENDIGFFYIPEIIEFETLFDSANLNPEHWIKIALIVINYRNTYDGFIILHGSDTMSWTASALSFMLSGINKPIIFTGSQIPLTASNSDAPGNLKMALQLALDSRICEIGICFGKKFLRANRSSKIATTHFQAFVSPNYPVLAKKRKSETIIYEKRLLGPQNENFFVPDYINTEAITILTIYPGISYRLIKSILSDRFMRGIVIRSYGTGNMPQSDGTLVKIMKDAIDRGIIFINISQCPIGRVTQDSYATGASFSQIGVISGRDMTLESAYAKLHILFSQSLSLDQIKKKMLISQQGEITSLL